MIRQGSHSRSATRTLLALVALLSIPGAHAYAGDGPAGLVLKPAFRHLTIEDGLSQSSVNAMLQDRQGFIWLGTQDGLNRYDGNEFKVWKTDPNDPHSLRDAYITAVAEAPDGTLWLGTDAAGFCRFDQVTGASQTVRIDPSHTAELDVYAVTHLIVDENGIVWVATQGRGLIRHDPESGESLVYRHDPSNPSTLPDDEVLALARDGDGHIWAATVGGLAELDLASGGLRVFRHEDRDASSLASNRVTALLFGQRGQLWVGTDAGLDRFTPADGTFRHIFGGRERELGLAGNDIQALVEDSANHLWIGGEIVGLLRYEPESEHVTRFERNTSDPLSLHDDQVHAIMLDRTGVLWVGNDLGVSVLDSHAKPFYHFRQDVSNPSGLSNNSVWSIWEDRRGNAWIATDDGVDVLDPRTGSFRVYRSHGADDSDGPAGDRYTVVREDSAGRIWLGYAYGGLDSFDPATQRFTHYHRDATGRTGAPSLRIYTIAESPDHVIWMGTADGLQSYDPVSGTFTGHFRDAADPYYLEGHACKVLLLDHRGRFWMGSWGDGLVMFDPRTGERLHYQYDPSDPTSLTSQTVLSLAEDRRGTIWVGTGSGLSRLDPKTGHCLRFTEHDGLPNNTVYGIEEDARGMLWVSTNFGLVHLDPQTMSFDHYRAKDGVQSNEFNMGAAHRGRSGRMYFGGINGFNVFYPDSIRSNPFVPPVVITDLRIFNKSVGVGEVIDGRTILHQPICETDSLTLSYKDYVISFSFSALHFASPEKNRFAYTLDGFDSGWNEVGSHHFATYTNLPPGNYVFRVRGSNNDGVWNEGGAAVAITVTPPFWRTAWFLTIAGLAILSLLNAVFRYRTRLMNFRTRELEARVQQRTGDLTRANHFLQQEIGERRRVEDALRVAKDQAEAATRAKSEFLANMSHEIRTPMNGVLGMTAILLETPLTSEQREHLEVVFSSARNLLGVINDILDFSKIEAGKLELENIDFDLRDVMEDACDLLARRAREKQLAFHVRIDHRLPAALRGDPGRLRQVLVNLANNAVKFTHHGGVTVDLAIVETHPLWAKVRCSVADSGVGIPADRLDCLFESFSQVDASTTRQYGGTGLGLAISKQLIDLMHGTIGVDSEEGKGTTFWFEVDLGLADTPALPGSLDRMPVLLRIDDATLQESLAQSLQFLGYEPVVAEAGQLAAILTENTDRRFAAALLGPLAAATDVTECPTSLPEPRCAQVGRWIAVSGVCETVTRGQLARLGCVNAVAAPVRTRKLAVALGGESDMTELPEFATPASTEPASPPTAAPSRADLPVLLAEDNPVNQKVASLLLQRLGYEVDVVVNGAEALTALARRHYGLVLMDVQMPTMDGYEATRRLRSGETGALDPDVPIVALTAHAMKGDRLRCLDVGMNDYLTKPIDAKALAAVLRKYLEPAPLDVVS